MSEAGHSLQPEHNINIQQPLHTTNQPVKDQETEWFCSGLANVTLQ